MIDRLLSSRIKKIIQKKSGARSVLLLGPRQTGKTTTIENLLPKKASKYNFRNQSQFRELIKKPESIRQRLEFLLEKEQDVTVFIDEIQLIPEVLSDLQILLDEFKNKVSLIITGSSARKLRRQKINLLPGRLFSLRLDPLLLWEFGIPIERNFIPWPSIDFSPRVHRIDLQDLLLYGALPGVYNESEKELLLKSYCDIYIKEEIMEEAKIRNLGAFVRFLEFAALSSGRPVTQTSLAHEASVSVDTIAQYYSILSDTLVLETFETWIPSRTKRMLLAEKRVIFDTGVKNALTRDLRSESKGTLEQCFEEWVGLELIRRIRALGLSWQVGHYRTKDKAEIDWILELDKDHVIAIEVKYSHSVSSESFRTIRSCMKEFPGKVATGMVIYLGETRKVDDGLYFVNWQEW